MHHSVKVQGVDVSAGCTTGQYMCSDGSCVTKEQRDELCPIIAKCTEDKPYRCTDGSCSTGPEACAYTPPCTGGMINCVDGTCRPKAECPRYDGCDINQYLCWEEQDCAKSLDDCVNNTQQYSSRYLRSPRIEQIGVCTGSSCRRDKRSQRVVATISRTQQTRVVIVDDPVDGESVVLTVPAQAFETTGSNAVYLYTQSATESEIRSAYNFVRREFFGRLREYIPYSRTVLSSPFYCWTSTNVASFKLNVTIEAVIDRTYLHSSDDICLASLDMYGNWRCVYPTVRDREAYPLNLIGNTASGSFGECAYVNGTSGGKLYAFIYTPGRAESTKTNDVLGFLQQYWPFIALACILVSLGSIFLGWYCYRKLRYRAKYLAEVRAQNDKRIELQRMQEVGAGGGNVGGHDQAHMEHNPLQVTIDNANSLHKLPGPKDREERLAAEEKAKIERTRFIARLEDENKKLLELVDNLKDELDGEEIA